MDIFNVLIVEDEANLAEFHSEYLKQNDRFNPVGIAKNLAEARSMIRLLKPHLILLDNFLPDGKGINLLKEIITNKSAPDVIFITAASDIETVREAVRCGVFDYILKPISFDRLQDALDRYIKYSCSLRASDNVNQRHVDELFNFQSKDTGITNLPKGIDPLTLEKVKEAFADSDTTHTAETLGQAVELSKTTARRYLEYSISSGFLQAVIKHGRIGRPERFYQRK